MDCTNWRILLKFVFSDIGLVNWKTLLLLMRDFFHLYQLFVPTPPEGGRNYIFKWVFFVQSILADRYIHRRELRLVSLESLSSVENGTKKIFLFLFLTGRYRGLNFRENRVNSVDFIHIFSEFLTKILPILIKFNKLYKNMWLILRLKTKYIVDYFHWFFFTNSG